MDEEFNSSESPIEEDTEDTTQNEEEPSTENNVADNPETEEESTPENSDEDTTNDDESSQETPVIDPEEGIDPDNPPEGFEVVEMGERIGLVPIGEGDSDDSEEPIPDNTDENIDITNDSNEPPNNNPEPTDELEETPSEETEENDDSSEPLLNEEDFNQLNNNTEDFMGGDGDDSLVGSEGDDFELLPTGVGTTRVRPDGVLEVIDELESSGSDSLTGGDDNNFVPTDDFNFPQNSNNNPNIDISPNDILNGLSNGQLAAEIASDIRNLARRNPRDVLRFNPTSTATVGIVGEFADTAGDLIANSGNTVGNFIEETLGINQ